LVIHADKIQSDEFTYVPNRASFAVQILRKISTSCYIILLSTCALIFE